jgi:hypothetical protein
MGKAKWLTNCLLFPMADQRRCLSAQAKTLGWADKRLLGSKLRVAGAVCQPKPKRWDGLTNGLLFPKADQRRCLSAQAKTLGWADKRLIVSES